MDSKLKSFAIQLLRRGTFRWKPRGEAKKKFKVQVGTFSTGRPKYGYKCNDCGDIHKSKDVKMDHIHPVVCPIEGFQGFDVYIERMFCDIDNFQCLCPTCHDNKTAMEREFKSRAKNEDQEELMKEYVDFIQKYIDKLPKV